MSLFTSPQNTKINDTFHVEALFIWQSHKSY